MMTLDMVPGSTKSALNFYDMSALAINPSDLLSIPEIAPKPRARRTTKKTTPPEKKATTATRSASGNTKAKAPVKKRSEARESLLTSQILRELLEKNPTLKSFTVEKIIDSIGTTAFGTSLMFFSIPEVLPIPIPGVSAIVALPTAVISAQMVIGKNRIILPKFMLKRSVPSKALATAIHAILPFLERAEKLTKPRWKWATGPAAKRLLGAFIFVLALAIAVPIPGMNMPQAIAIFIIALGLVENDGLLISIGVLIGIASLALLGGILFGISSLFGFAVGR